MEPKKTPIRWRFLVAGMILLANPVPALIDLVPDALGYLFLVLALTDASVGVGHFEEARTRFRHLAWLTLTKLPACLAVWGIAASSSFHEAAIIPVAAIAYGIGELCLLLPAVRALFRGFYHLGERLECPVALAPYGKRGTYRPENLETLTLAFLIFRVAMGTLPELLLARVSEEEISAIRVLTGYGFAAILACLFVSVLAGIWLSRAIPYFRAVGVASEGSAPLACLIAQHTEGEGTRILRTLSRLTVCLVAGAVCTLDLRLDGSDLLPDLLGAVFFCLFGYLAHRRAGGGKPILWVGGAYLLATLAETVFSALYYAEYSSPSHAGLYERAENLYARVTVSSLAAQLLLACLTVLLLRALLGAGIPYVGLKETFGHTLRDRTVRTLTRHGWINAALGVLSALVGAGYHLTVTDYVRVEQVEGWGQIPRLDWYPSLMTAVTLVWVLHLGYVCSRIREEARLSFEE